MYSRHLSAVNAPHLVALYGVISRFSSFNQPLFCCYYSIFFIILDLFCHSWIFIFLLIAALIQYPVIFPLVVVQIYCQCSLLVFVGAWWFQGSEFSIWFCFVRKYTAPFTQSSDVAVSRYLFLGHPCRTNQLLNNMNHASIPRVLR